MFKRYMKSWENKGYASRHVCIKKLYGPPTRCETCSVEGKKYEWSNVSGKYLLDRKDWQELCVGCHRLYDRFRKNETRFKEINKVDNDNRNFKEKTVERYGRVCELYLSGLSLLEVSEIEKCSRERIRQILEMCGVERREAGFGSWG